MPIDIDWQVFVTAIVLVPVAYAATNVDNLLIMSTLAAGRVSRRSLVTGFLVASLAVLVIVSLATFIARAIPHEVLGYLGFVPMSIGIYLLLFTGSAADESAGGVTTWPAVAGADPAGGSSKATSSGATPPETSISRLSWRYCSPGGKSDRDSRS